MKGHLIGALLLSMTTMIYCQGSVQPSPEQLMCISAASIRKANAIQLACSEEALADAAIICDGGACFDVIERIFIGCGFTGFTELCELLTIEDSGDGSGDSGDSAIASGDDGSGDSSDSSSDSDSSASGDSEDSSSEKGNGRNNGLPGNGNSRRGNGRQGNGRQGNGRRRQVNGQGNGRVHGRYSS